MGFDPCERAEHYAGRQQPDRFDVQAEQRHASEHGAIPDAVAAEIERLDRADLLILQYPMWWHLPPAMLKGWLDRVLIYGNLRQMGVERTGLRMGQNDVGVHGASPMGRSSQDNLSDRPRRFNSEFLSGRCPNARTA